MTERDAEKCPTRSVSRPVVRVGRATRTRFDHHVRDDDDDDDDDGDAGDDGDDATGGDDAGDVCGDAPGGAIGDVHVRGTTRARARAHAGDDDGGDRGSRGGDGGACLCVRSLAGLGVRCDAMCDAMDLGFFSCIRCVRAIVADAVASAATSRRVPVGSLGGDANEPWWNGVDESSSDA